MVSLDCLLTSYFDIRGVSISRKEGVQFLMKRGGSNLIFSIKRSSIPEIVIELWCTLLMPCNLPHVLTPVVGGQEGKDPQNNSVKRTSTMAINCMELIGLTPREENLPIHNCLGCCRI